VSVAWRERSDESERCTEPNFMFSVILIGLTC
jgi:hypothetical protein